MPRLCILLLILVACSASALGINNQTHCVVRTEILLNCQITVFPRQAVVNQPDGSPYTVQWPDGQGPALGSRLCVNFIPDCSGSTNVGAIEAQVINRPGCLISLRQSASGLAARMTDPCRE